MIRFGHKEASGKLVGSVIPIRLTESIGTKLSAGAAETAADSSAQAEYAVRTCPHQFLRTRAMCAD